MNKADDQNLVDWLANRPVADPDFYDGEVPAACGKGCYHQRHRMPCPENPWA